jgi:two-component system chemotaxis response regulator CheB
MKKWLDQKENISLRITSDFFCWIENLSKKTWTGWQGDIHEIEKLLSDINVNIQEGCHFKFVGNEKALNVFKSKYQYKNSEKNTKYILRNKPFNFVFYKIDFKFKLSVEDIKISETPTIVKKDKFKVLLVDDSKTILTLLSTMLKTDSAIEIVGMVTNPLEAEKVIREKKPDVMTLDIHMPEMNGVELLKDLKNKIPIPTIMITSLNIQEGGLVLEALENGAFDYIQKPRMEDVANLTPVLIEKIKLAANSNVAVSTSEVSKSFSISPKISFKGNLDSQLIALGASTGGTNALADILTLMPEKIPPIIIVQHIPPIFSAAFAKRLNELCKFDVKESEDGDVLRPGLVIVAKGGVQLKLKKQGEKIIVVHTDDPPLNRFKPSVDYMFNSVADLSTSKLIAAALLTGMGNDGAKGMLKMKNVGIETVAQDEKSCVVFGMPREAIEIGGASYIESLLKIPERLSQILDHSSFNKKKVG